MEEIQDHLDRITYKPGWSFLAYEGRWEGHHIAITTCVPDAFNPGKNVTLDVHSMLPPMESTDDLDRWLMWRLARIEVHEMREWYKRDGWVIDSPHVENAERDL